MTRGRGILFTFALLVVIAVVAVRAYMATALAYSNLIYTFTLSRLDGIMIGSAVALAEPALKRFLAVRPSTTTFTCWLSFIALVGALIFAQRSYVQATPWGFFAFAILAATFVFCVPRLPDRDVLRRLLCWRPVQYVGQRSYGLYLYHYPIFGACEALRVQGDLANYIGVATLKVVLSLIMTEFAWRFIEKPVLALKIYFQTSPERQSLTDLSPTTRHPTT